MKQKAKYFCWAWSCGNKFITNIINEYAYKFISNLEQIQCLCFDFSNAK